MTTRVPLVALVAALLIGATAWVHSPAPTHAAPVAVAPTWTDTIDAWYGLCDSAAALIDADSLKMPCLLGPGARRPPQLDSIVAGTGTLHVVKVTDYTNTTGDSTLRAAIDSANAWSDGKSCTVIVFPKGGTVYFNATSQNADGMECVYVLGQTAQGEGVNFAGSSMRARSFQDFYWGYSYNRATDGSSGWALGSPTQMMGGSGAYAEHLSRSWHNGSGGSLLVGGCGTDAVPMVGTICRDFTFSRNLLYESAWTHPTGIHTGGTRSDTTGTYAGDSKFARVLVYGNYMANIGQRCPLTGNTDSVLVLDVICYNFRNAYMQMGSSRPVVRSRVDVFNSYFRYGPMTTVDGNSGWSIYVFDALTTGDSILLNARYVRANQNDYDSLSLPAALHRGPQRTTACDADVAAYGGSECQVDGDSLPTAIWQSVTDTLVLGSSTAQPEYHAMTDVRAEHIIQGAGNFRYLGCDGTWTLRSDTLDTRARTEWVDSTGLAVETELVNVAANRSYGTPAAGTTCSDADNDGLPDLWEFEVSGVDSTSIAADSVLNGLPAILWYGSGRNMAGGLIGCNGTCSAVNPTPDPTFGEVARYIYLVATVDTLGAIQPRFTGTETIHRVYYRWTQLDSALVLVCGGSAGTPLDSATVDGRLSVWNSPFTSTALQVRDEVLPGNPC